MADDTPLLVAKEITLSIMSKVTFGGDTSPEGMGKAVGKLFKVILKEVVESMKEAK
jgi:hypothetical protein